MLQSLHLNKTAISSCLVGIECRYDGKSSRDLSSFKGCISFCPEMLGGLNVPRIPCQIDRGDGFDVIAGKARVIGKDGKDYTEQFLDGARKALEICLENNIRTVILKEKSPSCGVNSIYNNDTLVLGCGVTCALLKKHKIQIISDTEVSHE